MHIAIDAVGIKHSGGAIVLKSLAAAASANPAIERLTVFCSPRAVRSFDLDASAKIHLVERLDEERSLLRRILWYWRLLGEETRRSGADFLVCLNGMGTRPTLGSWATLIQQSLPFSQEALSVCSRAERLRMWLIRKLMERSCAGAGLVLVQTPSMASWISHAFRLPPHRYPSIFIPCGALNDNRDCESTAGNIARTMGLVSSGSRLLYVGNSEAYKNVGTIINSMPALRQLVSDATLFLTWPGDDPAERPPGVVYLGYLKGSALREAYELATALVMPSLVETVGLPQLEAMSVGTPVLAADRPYAHDVCGPAALFFDPRSRDDFVGKAARLMTEEPLRRQLRNQGLELTKLRREERPYDQMIAAILAAAENGPDRTTTAKSSGS